MFKFILAFVGLLQVVTAQYKLQLDKSSYTASDSVKISWSTAGSVLQLSDLTSGVVELCTCNSSATFGCSNIKKDLDLSDGSLTVPVSSFADLGPSGSYMFQLTAINPSKKSEYAISYTDDFVKITGMTGTGDANTDCNVPTDTNNNVPGTGTASSSTVQWTSWTLPASYRTVSSYLIPYTLQAGPTRVAPFQKTPGTKITATTTPTRRYPTSSYSPFTTYVKNKYMPLTTLTPSPASPAIQHPNFVPTIATTPSGYDPTRVLPTLAPFSSSSSSRARKRWAD